MEWIECIWVKQLGKTCVGINWDLFSGVEQIKVSISLDFAFCSISALLYTCVLKMMTYQIVIS